MLWVTLFIALVVSLAVVLYVVRPLLDRNSAPVFVEDDRLTDLLSRKDAVLQAIKDLEFDRNVGKLEEGDYVRFNQSLSRQAVGLIQQIEKIAPTSTQQEDLLEQEISKLRKTKDRVAEVKVATAKKVAVSPNGHPPTPAASKPKFCTSCGQPVSANHKFCANCGTALT